jgi:hypothetical protein
VYEQGFLHFVASCFVLRRVHFQTRLVLRQLLSQLNILNLKFGNLVNQTLPVKWRQSDKDVMVSIVCRLGRFGVDVRKLLYALIELDNFFIFVISCHFKISNLFFQALKLLG